MRLLLHRFCDLLLLLVVAKLLLLLDCCWRGRTTDMVWVSPCGGFIPSTPLLQHSCSMRMNKTNIELFHDAAARLLWLIITSERAAPAAFVGVLLLRPGAACCTGAHSRLLVCHFKVILMNVV